MVDKETIYIVNRDGTGVERIVPEVGKAAMNPVWDPRGSSLVYQQITDNNTQLFKIDLASRIQTQLTRIGFVQANMYADWFDPVVLSVSSGVEKHTTLWGRLKRP